MGTQKDTTTEVVFFCRNIFFDSLVFIFKSDGTVRPDECKASDLLGPVRFSAYPSPFAGHLPAPGRVVGALN